MSSGDCPNLEIVNEIMQQDSAKMHLSDCLQCIYIKSEPLKSVSKFMREQLYCTEDLFDAEIYKTFKYSYSFDKDLSDILAIIESTIYHTEDFPLFEDEEQIEASPKVKQEKHESKTAAYTRPKNIIEIQHVIEEEFTGFIGFKDAKEYALETACIHLKGFIKNNKKAMNLLMSGNPGTGKTELAGILGKIFYRTTILKSDTYTHFVASELKAPYVGQTAPKVNNLFTNNSNGTILIDEFYSIGDDEFSRDAIPALMQNIEDGRGDRLVVFAGYQDKIEQFLKLNRGLDSRINDRLYLDNYSVDELIEIAHLMACKDGYEVATAADKVVGDYLQSRMKDKNFANAREVRNLVEGAERKQACTDKSFTNNILEPQHFEKQIEKLSSDKAKISQKNVMGFTEEQCN